jgi:hypothetical protein
MVSVTSTTTTQSPAELSSLTEKVKKPTIKKPKQSSAPTKNSAGSKNLSAEEIKKLTDLATKNDDILKIVERAAGPQGSEAELNQVMTLLQTRSARAQAVSNVIRELFDTIKRLVANLAG